ncbi:MAG TPA: alkaline phosphatase family protein [Nitrospirae bacterium]|nr:alkaline phosphatase family protein [Nitrospirota bacterium]
MSRYIKNRFALVALLIVIFVAISLTSRTILLFAKFDQLDFGLVVLIKLFLVGLFYDFVAAIYYVAPFAAYVALMPDKIFNNKFHKYILWLFLFLNINLLVFNAFSEWVFWNEFGKRFNFIAVDYLVYTHEVIYNILESYPIPLLLTAVFIISSVILYFIYKKRAVLGFAFNSTQGYLQRLKVASVFILLPFLFFNILNKQSLADISNNQYDNELSKDGLYSLFSAFRNNTLDYDEFYKTENIKTVMSNLKSLTGFDDNSLKFIKKDGNELKYNIILIMVESLSAEYMGVFGDNRGLTPNLDKLAEKSLFFNNFYATGTRTIRGMEAVTLSVPPTPGRSIVKRPDNHNMFSSGFIFKEKGYENKFIYAGYGYFDNMNDFFSHNGFSIVDRTNMTKEEITFSNVWGVCDEDLFNKALKESDKSYKKGKPFFNYIMTTSNHRPYTYPDGKIDIPSHTGRSGGVKYTDYSIEQFLKKAEHKPWFKNTIFVIVADHNGGSAGKTSLPAWRYKIPLLIYAPNIIAPNTISKVSSQIDLMPTLFSIMNWSYESEFYGKDILDKKFRERAFIGTYQKLGFLRNKRLVILEPDRSVHEYNIVNQGLRSIKYKEITPLKKDESDAITYYQSASYLYKHHLDKWKQ